MDLPKYRLVSEKVCGPKCVELFYFMENFRKSEFRLSAWKNGQEDRLWFSTGNGKKVSDWTRAVVEINAEDEECSQVLIIPRGVGIIPGSVGIPI